MPVIAAFKLHNVFAFCISPRQPDGRHRRLGPGTHKANFLQVRKRRNYQLGEVGLDRRRRSKARPIAHRGQNGIEYVGRSVPKNQRPPRAHVINELIFVRIPDARPFAANNESGFATDRAERSHRRIDPARNQGGGAFLQTLRLLDLTGCCGLHQLLPYTRKSKSERKAYRSQLAMPAINITADLQVLENQWYRLHGRLRTRRTRKPDMPRISRSPRQNASRGVVHTNSSEIHRSSMILQYSGDRL